MNFVSHQYLIFIVIVFFIYWRLNTKRQNLFLLIASYIFYGFWDWRFLSLIIISTFVDFVCGSNIHKSKTHKEKKRWLYLTLAANLGTLGFFKYFNFFADSLFALGQTVGWNVSYTTLNIILPVGISFYTFQTLSYSIDIFKGDLKPTKSFLNFATFVAFFPQLVAGPIVRAKEFIFQIEKKRNFSGNDLEEGLKRFLFGFLKNHLLLIL